MSGKTSHQTSIKKSSILPKVLLLIGIVGLIATILILKNQPSQPTIPTDQTAEVQLDQYLKEGKPTFVFFHSNNCQSCIDMMGIVDKVYPEFKDGVALIDVNVYDPDNQNLLQRAKINTIPTQVFINASGQGQITLGVMSPEDLRQKLMSLVEGT